MANRITGLRVDRISFVKDAAVRDPQDPTKPRRALLWKSEGKGDQMTALQKDESIVQSLTDLHGHREALRKMDPSDRPFGVLEAVERAHDKLYVEYRDRLDPGSASALESRQLAKSDQLLHAHSKGFKLAAQRAEALGRKEGLGPEVAWRRVLETDPEVREAYEAERAAA